MGYMVTYEILMLSRVWLFATPQTVACQVPLSTAFSRQEYWSGLPFLLQGIFPTQRLNPSQIFYCLSHRRSIWYYLIINHNSKTDFCLIFSSKIAYFEARDFRLM